MCRTLLMALLIGSLTQSTRAEPPATQPLAVDLSTPKAAARTMFAAVAAADALSLSQVFCADTPQEHELVAAYSDLIVAGRRLRDAARDKFVEDNNAALPNPPPAVAPAPTVGPSAEDSTALDSADLQVSGDTATLRLSDRPTPIKLRHSGDAWRVDLADYAATTPAQLAEQIEVNRALAAAMEEATDEITTGKYASAQEAESAVQQKIHAVIAKQLHALPPTRPSTGAAVQPATLPSVP